MTCDEQGLRFCGQDNAFRDLEKTSSNMYKTLKNIPQSGNVNNYGCAPLTVKERLCVNIIAVFDQEFKAVASSYSFSDRPMYMLRLFCFI